MKITNSWRVSPRELPRLITVRPWRLAGCPRLPRREAERKRERGRSVKFIVINRSRLDKRGFFEIEKRRRRGRGGREGRRDEGRGKKVAQRERRNSSVSLLVFARRLRFRRITSFQQRCRVSMLIKSSRPLGVPGLSPRFRNF